MPRNTLNLDRSKDFAEVHGKSAHRYIQDGMFYDNAGKRVNEDGSPFSAAQAKRELDEAFAAEEAERKAAEAEAEAAARAEAEADAAAEEAAKADDDKPTKK